MENRISITSEAIAEALRPIITRADEAAAEPVLIALTRPHWEALQDVWSGLLGELHRDSIRLGDPIDMGGAYRGN